MSALKMLQSDQLPIVTEHTRLDSGRFCTFLRSPFLSFLLVIYCFFDLPFFHVKSEIIFRRSRHFNDFRFKTFIGCSIYTHRICPLLWKRMQGIPGASSTLAILTLDFPLRDISFYFISLRFFLFPFSFFFSLFVLFSSQLGWVVFLMDVRFILFYFFLPIIFNLLCLFLTQSILLWPVVFAQLQMYTHREMFVSVSMCSQFTHWIAFSFLPQG